MLQAIGKCLRLGAVALAAGALLSVGACNSQPGQGAGTAQRPPGTPAEQLRAEVEAFLADGSDAAEERARLTQEAERQLAQTSKSDPKTWGSLTLTRAMLRMSEEAPGDSVAPQLDAAAMVRDALTVLTKENAPYEWATGQMLRLNTAYTIDPEHAENVDMAALQQESKAAHDAALTVFTVEAYPFEHFLARCNFETMRLAYTDAYANIGYNADTEHQVSSALTPIITTCVGTPAAGAQSMIGSRAMTLMPLLGMMAYGMGGDSAGQMIATISRSRAMFLSSVLTMDQLGLSADDLARARALRAQADRAAEESGAQTFGELRYNAPFWRASSELLEILLRARPQIPAPRIEDALIVPMVMDQASGIVAARSRAGAGTVLTARGATLQSMMMQLSQNADLGEGAAAWTELARSGDSARAVADFRSRFEPAWGGVLHDAARRAGAAANGRLIILADGMTSAMPFAVLRDPATGRSLLEDYEIIYTPSLVAYEAARRRAAQTRPPVLAAITAPDTNLAFAPIEARVAEASFGQSIVRPRDSGKASVLAALRGATHWHFSTHGVFNSRNARLSGLDLGNGQNLTLSDLYFAEQPIGAPALVVMSACETALFDGAHTPEEFIGLPSGFIQNGAAGVIGSQWRVSDISTTMLMAKFYDLHIGQAQRPSQALRAAQIWLKGLNQQQAAAYIADLAARRRIDASQATQLNRGLARMPDAQPFSDPYHWGGWIYFGA